MNKKTSRNITTSYKICLIYHQKLLNKDYKAILLIKNYYTQVRLQKVNLQPNNIEL